ncbi:CheW protein [Desulfarculus baarsii DSM 2075]|uniref:CheW protein n=1 Tax=Desulfarculus baarsii (strain ATCC 33931 / DSM 2075 / LMG 7858 / VKM B-1802 / 2st14) TaxID=644282 RepID=E1QGB8_DESB2|nr:chemotaxis protein CheW [Desulfarculus baarsii]ADK83630.1 CheW protein [Desulfarculus baarsii DSM 2075]
MKSIGRQNANAIPVGKIVGIVRQADIWPLPGAPDYLAGLACLHGRLIPILDIDGRNLPAALDNDILARDIVIVENTMAGEATSLFGVIIDQWEKAGADYTPGSMHQPPADFPYAKVVAETAPRPDLRPGQTRGGKALAS